MGTTTCDVLVIGGGIIGCSTAYNLAANSAAKVVLLERGEICSGGTAKSCAIVRTHYSVRSNLFHAVESLKIFSNFDAVIGGEVGWRRTGYLIVGPESHRAPMEEVFAMQNEHGIDTAVISHEEAQEIHPLLRFSEGEVIGYDTQAGYADPYLATTAYARRAGELGVAIQTDTAVTDLDVKGTVKQVETTTGRFEAPVVILAVGPWTYQLARMIGADIPYVNSRHKVITLKIDRPYELDWPIVKDLTTDDKIYFRSEIGGVVLVGTGDHGEPLDDPDSLRDVVDHEHVSRIDSLITHRMPAFAEAQFTAGWNGPYDITPDWNPIIGALPGYEGVLVAVGFSGHGFKLAPTIGEGLAQLALGMKPRVPIADYSMERFALGGQGLYGAYGIGSIS